MEQRDCFLNEEELNLYIDEELLDIRKENLKGHLLSCKSCASQFEIASNLKIAVKRACADSAAPAWVRDKIIHKINAEEPGREGLFWDKLKNLFGNRPMAPVTIAAALVIVLAASIFYGVPQKQNMPFIKGLVHEHYEYLEEAVDLGIRSNDPEEISGWLTANIGVDYRLPAGGKIPVPGGACKLQEDGKTIGYVYFDSEDKKVSLFMLEDTNDNLFGPTKMNFDNISLYCGSCTGMNYVLWKDDNLICVLVGELSESSLVEMARGFI